jgi:hypothetical protein
MFFTKDSRFGYLSVALNFFYEEKKSKAETPRTQNIQFERQISNTSSSTSLNASSSFLSKSNPNLSNSGGEKDFMLDTCSKLIEKFENPYLKAVFNYIINKDDAISKILVNIQIKAFAYNNLKRLKLNSIV